MTLDTGFLLIGGSNSENNGDKTEASRGSLDVWIIKLDGHGNKIWDKRYGGYDSDAADWAVQCTDQSYIIAASSYSNISGEKSENRRGGDDFWILKTDEVGNKTWDKTFGGALGDLPLLIKPSKDGGYLTAGKN